MTSATFLPYGRQTLDDADIAAVVEVLRGDFLTQGPTVEAFEMALAARVGAAEAVACSNGTAALHLAYLALELEEGDAVVVPTNTFLATASAARLVGAEVAFADVDPETGLMGAAHATAAIARARAAGWRVRALAPVHFAGQCADMEALGALAEAEGLAVVEDACHALGAKIHSGSARVPVGACARSAMTVFSFHPVKTVAAGEGGAVTTNDPALAVRLRAFRNHGMSRDATGFVDRSAGFAADGTANPWYYEMAEPGFNYRLTDIQSALALSQMRRLDAFVARRQRLMTLYAERLAPLAPLVRPLGQAFWCDPAWHLCVALIDFAAARVERGAVMTALRLHNVGTQVHYIPVHRQPYWRERLGDLVLSGADAYYARALSLPLFPAMADADVDRVVETLGAVLVS